MLSSLFVIPTLSPEQKVEGTKILHSPFDADI
jgi:hypothetical protein